MKRFLTLLATLVLSVGLTACGTPGPQPGEMEIRRGTIEQINPVQIGTTHQQGVGAGGRAGVCEALTCQCSCTSAEGREQAVRMALSGILKRVMAATLMA